MRQEEPGGARARKEEPGRTNRRQEEPGGAKESQLGGPRERRPRALGPICNLELPGQGCQARTRRKARRTREP